MSVELIGVETRYDSFSFGPVTTTFDSGVTAVLGPSGSGKTTLLSLIAGFTTPSRGRIVADGTRIDDRAPEDRGVGMVFQTDALFPHLSVEENLAFGATPGTDLEGVCGMLAIRDLLERYPSTLSGGEKQRVALARALVSDPRVLLLDEPLASLDAPIRSRLQVELGDVLADLDIPVVYVTHDREAAAVMGDRLAVLHDGEVVQEGSTESVFDAPDTAFVAEFLGMENVFPGTVVESDGPSTTVDVGGTRLAARGSARSTDVAVAIHPGAIDVGPPESREEADPEAIDGADPGDGVGPNAMECRVDQVVDGHRTATVLLDCDGLGRLTASVGTERGTNLERGTGRIATVDPSDVHLTAPYRPEAGGDRR